MKNTENKSSVNEDIHDNPRDIKHLRSEETILDLPEVKDIPGQEHIRPPKMNEFKDSTLSSSDEEGKDIFDREEELTDNESAITPEEKELLQRSENSMGGEEDQNLEKARLDYVDEDGEELNQQIDFSGKDLDVPGAEEDDASEEIGEEDEENNSYSLGGDRNDD